MRGAGPARAALALALLMLATPTELQAQVRDPWRQDDVAGTAQPPATVAAIALSIRSRAIQDSRCYLMNGGAVESFFISEDSPVGSVIGTLSVNGDPDEERGDITLRVQEKGAAVGIAAGTKNLTLLRELDREEKLGPSNVYVNVRCDRRLTADPSFIVPVSVRVWDVNDNAPVWAGAPFRARVSELAPAGARLLAARAADADQAGPHATVRYSVLPGPHAEYVTFANELDGVVVVKRALDYETLPSLTVTLRAEDQGSPPRHADASLQLEVLDADDQNPAFAHDHYRARLPPAAREGTVLVPSPEPISAADQDTGINAPLHYSATGDGKRLVRVDRDTGQVAATALLLQATQPTTIVIKAVQVDNADRYALATLTVSPAAPPSSPAPPAGPRFTRGELAVSVSEGAAPGAVLATLHTEPPAAGGPPLQFYVSEREFLDKFAINGAGELILRRALDYEERDQYRYQVMVTDGHQNDTAYINITVTNVNEWEPRFRYPQYEFRVEPGGGDAALERAGAGLLPVGTLDVFDGDKHDAVTLTLKGSDASMFYINNSGAMFLRQEALTALNGSVLRVVATATDSGAPPRETSVPVVVHVGRARGAGPPRAALGAPALGAAAGAVALLAGLLCALLLLHRRRRRSKSSPTQPGKPYLAHEKATPSSPGPINQPGALDTPGAPGAAGTLGGSGSLQSVSAGASTILANSSSSLDLRESMQNNGISGNAGSTRGPPRARSKVSPAPVPPAPPALMSDHVGGAGGGRSGVAWPSATIPARVKKLSWDDAADKKDSAPELHDATNPALHDTMNLTVYF